MSNSNVNPNAVLRSMIDEMPRKDTKPAAGQVQNLMSQLRASQGVQEATPNANREDFGKLVAARLWIVHPDGKFVSIDGRPFKEIQGLPTRFGQKHPFRVSFTAVRNGKETNIEYEGREGKLSLEIWNDDTKKRELVEAGSYSFQPLEKETVFVNKSETFMDVEYQEQVEAQIPVYPLGDDKFIGSFGFMGLITLNVTRPHQTTVTYVVYNCSATTVAKNRQRFGRALANWNRQSEQDRHINRNQAPKLRPESYLLRPAHLDVIVTGQTKFVAQLIDKNNLLGPQVVETQEQMEDNGRTATSDDHVGF